VRRIVGSSLKRYTSNTIVEFDGLLEQLSGVRRTGYATDLEEYLPGVVCVGAAIRDHTGGIVGSISASTPTMRADDGHLTLMREQVLDAARGLSAEFGYAASQGQLERPVAN
jgi:IclR family acetate operon transcriptional repressor